MSKHCVLKSTDNQTVHPVCQLPYDGLMTLIVWHRMQGDWSIFKRLEKAADKADTEGHPCMECQKTLYALVRDPEFKKLKKMPVN